MKYTTHPTKHALWSTCKNFVIILMDATNFFLIKREGQQKSDGEGAEAKTAQSSKSGKKFPIYKVIIEIQPLLRPLTKRRNEISFEKQRN